MINLEAFTQSEAEQMTIAALLNKPEVYDEISALIDESDFYHKAHEVIFLGIKYLYLKNMYDVKTLIKLLEMRNKLQDIGGAEYIQQLRGAIPTLNLVKFYAEKIKECSIYRKAIQLSREIQDITENGADGSLDQFIAAIHDRMNRFDVVKQSNLINVKESVLKQKDQILNGDIVRSPLIGFGQIDRWMNGMGRDRLIVIAARPGTGKTALALSVLRSVSKQDFGPPAMFSLEMGQHELTCRMLADISGVAFSKIMRRELDPDQKERVDKATEQLAQYDFYIDDKARMDVAYISAQARRLKREHGKLGVILIDYAQILQLHPRREENKADAIGRATGELKALARELGCSVILLSQLNRDIHKRSNKRPVMSDLKDSGSLEQDADMIIFLHRDEEKSEELRAHIDFIVDKGRQTGIADFQLHFLGAIQRFGEKV
jgi:replicative DNA helicase